MLSKMPCYWYANVANIFEKNSIHMWYANRGNILSTKTLLTGIIFFWLYFYAIFYGLTMFHTITSIWAKSVYTDFHHKIHSTFIDINILWNMVGLHKCEIKYCEICQLQFYLKPDGLLCFITLTYQHNHLYIAFED